MMLNSGYIDIKRLPKYEDHIAVQKWLFYMGHEWADGSVTPLYQGSERFLAYIVIRNTGELTRIDEARRQKLTPRILRDYPIDHTYYALAMVCGSKLGRLLL